LAALQFQLMIVSDMLVIASPASAENGTDRLRTVDRPQDDFLELRAIKTAPVLDQFSFDPFSIDSKRHKNDFPVDPTDTCAAECDIMDLQFHNRA
jgi:hypothetical protein